MAGLIGITQGTGGRGAKRQKAQRFQAVPQQGPYAVRKRVQFSHQTVITLRRDDVPVFLLHDNPPGRDAALHLPT